LSRIRHYGLFANAARAANLAKARALLDVPAPPPAADANPDADAPVKPAITCPCCGGRMIPIEVFERGAAPRTAPTRPSFGIDSS
jgi:hypothetical protein